MDLLLYNHTKRSYDEEKVIQTLFEEQVIKTGDKTAAIYRDQTVTYEQLNKKANQLARILRKKGVGPQKIVGIMVNRSVDMLIGIMGILKAGGCYLPIDPKFPQSRIDYMLEDSKATLLITHAELDHVVNRDIEILHLAEETYQGEDTNLPNLNTSMDPAYIIYTSGSTGKPKGVLLPHKAVHNFINGITDIIDFSPEKVIVSLTTISFDIFVLESLLPLSKGLTIIIADPMTFAKDMGDKRVNIVQTTPSTMKLIMNDKSNLKYLESMTDILLGGEPFPKRLLTELQQAVSARIYNMYGPTETTVWSMVKDLTSSDSITIGTPIANTQICLVDSDYKPVPYGEEGEICIAGDGVALGYLYREDLTKERFIADVFSEGKRMYRTGDLGKYLPNGEIEFLGRIDSQVKVRGFRIELEEIENNLIKMQEIKECVVSTKKNKNDEKYLVGYYVAQDEISNSDIIQFLKNTLPVYMIPGIYKKIDEIPLTPNGKVNHLALPEVEIKRANLDVEYVMPETELEEKIVSIWLNVLNIDKAGVLDNFFDLGGNSIHIAQIFSILNPIYKEKLEIADLFTYPTVRKLCEYLNKNHSEKLDNILEDDYYAKNTVAKNVIPKQLSLPCDVSTIDNSLLVSIFMYLISDISLSNKVNVVCDFGEGFKKISCDFADKDDLEEVMKIISSSYNANDSIITSQQRKELTASDDQAILFTISFGQQEPEKSFLENEVHMWIPAKDQKVTMYFNGGKLDSAKMEAFFIQYINFIASVKQEL